MSDEILRIEKQLFELTTRLNELRKSRRGKEVQNYTFRTLDGEVTLLDLFGEQDRLLVIHNMGQGCRDKVIPIFFRKETYICIDHPFTY